MRAFVFAFVLGFAACSGSPGGPAMTNTMNAPEMTPQADPVVSSAILARDPVANEAQVKHILIGWKGTQDTDPRAQQRTKADAEALVKAILGQLKAGTPFEDLMKQYSEDPGSATTGRAYPVSPSADLVIEFKQLGLRLDVGEIGVVQSDFGFHIMKRVQ